MPRFIYLVLVFVFLGHTLDSSAQFASLKCLDSKYKWKATPQLDATIPELQAVEGADILFEKQRVSFLRSKPELLSIVFERHVIFRFGTRDAIAEHSKFHLPESFDPPTDYQDVAIADRDSLARPLYFEATLESFAGRVIGTADRSRVLETEGHISYQRKKIGRRFYRGATFDLELVGITPGDTVELVYKYIVPFRDNWFRFNSSKHYFHGDLYKHRYELQVDATRSQGLNLRGAPADSIALTKKKRYAYWRLNDLKACLNEVNARPHRDLPYVVYGTAVDSELYQHGHIISASLGGVPYAYSNVEYWVSLLKQRESLALDYRRLARKKSAIGQQGKVRTWLKQFGGVEKSQVEIALLAHDRIARDFSFQWDDAWFDNEDMTLVKHGNLFEDKTVREIGRYSQYSKFLSELKLKYFTAYVQDARVGTLAADELTDLYQTEYMFLLQENEVAYFMHPKHKRGGLLVNEKPFYWEGTKALLGDLDKLWGNGNKTVELIDLPRMNPMANIRVTALDVHFDKGGRASLEAQVLLGGQFSTMTRHAYLFGERDSTVMEEYGNEYLHRFKDQSTELISGPLSLAPYTTEIKVAATSNKMKVQSSGSDHQISLSQLFPFSVPQGFVAADRALPFYWDFEQRDRYHVNLIFPEGVTVEESERSYGSEALGAQLFVEVKQHDPTTVSVTALLQISKARVPVSKAMELETLLSELAKLNRYQVAVEWDQ